MTLLKNFFYAIWLVIGAVFLLAIILPFEIIEEIRWRRER